MLRQAQDPTPSRQVDVVAFVLMRVRNKHPSGPPSSVSPSASGVRGAASGGDARSSSGDASCYVDIPPLVSDGASVSDLDQLTHLNLTSVIQVRQ